MAGFIITGDQPDVKLNPRGSSERVPDTYARPAAPPPADTSVGDALTNLSKIAQGIDDKQAAKDKELAHLYQAQLTAAMQGSTGFNQTVADGVLNSVHPRVRSYVTELYGKAKGEEAFRQWFATPEGQAGMNDAVSDPAAYERWKQSAAAKGMQAAGEANLWYRNGFLQAFNAATASHGRTLDANRNQAITQQAIIQSTQNIARGTEAGTPDVTRAPDPQKAAATVASAQEMGIDPIHLAAIMSFETKGKFDPNMDHDVYLPEGKAGVKIPGFAKGLIGFIPDNWEKYGIKPNMTYEEQLKSVGAYLRDRARQTGVELRGLDAKGLYKLINPGYNGDQFLREVQGQGHLKRAMEFLGYNQNTARMYSGGGEVAMANQGKIRDKPITQDLSSQMSTAAKQIGARVVVASGGQDPKGSGGKRTGSTLHDHGNAADVDLVDPTTKKVLDARNPEDRQRMAKFITNAVAAGANGVGFAPNYMGNSRIHVGGGSVATWGAKVNGVRQPAPQWVKDAHAEGMRLRGTQSTNYTASSTPPEQPRHSIFVGGLTHRPGDESLTKQSERYKSSLGQGASVASFNHDDDIQKIIKQAKETPNSDITLYSQGANIGNVRQLLAAGIDPKRITLAEPYNPDPQFTKEFLSKGGKLVYNPGQTARGYFSGVEGLPGATSNNGRHSESYLLRAAATQQGGPAISPAPEESPAGVSVDPVPPRLPEFNPLTSTNPKIAVWRSRFFDADGDFKNISGDGPVPPYIRAKMNEELWKQVKEKALSENDPTWLTQGWPARHLTTERRTEMRVALEAIEKEKAAKLRQAAAAAKEAKKEAEEKWTNEAANLMLRNDKQGYDEHVKRAILAGNISTATVEKLNIMKEKIGWGGTQIVRDPEAEAATATAIELGMARAVAMGRRPEDFLFDYVKTHPSAAIGGQKNFQTLLEKARTLGKESDVMSSPLITGVFTNVVAQTFGIDMTTLKTTPKNPQHAAIWLDYHNDMLRRVAGWRADPANNNSTAPDNLWLREQSQEAAKRVIKAYSSESDMKQLPVNLGGDVQPGKLRTDRSSASPPANPPNTNTTNQPNGSSPSNNNNIEKKFNENVKKFRQMMGQ